MPSSRLTTEGLHVVVLGHGPDGASLTQLFSSGKDWDVSDRVTTDRLVDVIILAGTKDLDSSQIDLYKQQHPEASMHGVGAAIIRLMPISVLVRSALCHSAACTGEPVLLLRFGYPLRRYITSRRTSVDFMRLPGSVN